MDKVNLRSYEVTTEDGRTFRRNRKHLRLTHEPIEETSDNDQPPPIETVMNDFKAHEPLPSSVQIDNTAINRRTSDRIRSRPKYLDYYVTK